MTAPILGPRGCLPCAVCLGQKAAESDKCTHCEKVVCDGCTVQCEKCMDLFCNFCSTSNYDTRYDRTFCFGCNEEERLANKSARVLAARELMPLEQMAID
eukprot:TRINITY_DN37612_c0_g1_i1.p1 TRINITY_DN37612_c0_g1~~TRINITY_DN37612_c0_g1_i1.p1  ORF type:complete len:100 (+),score=16.55 TRINITY_DN37612_c0_g1_i1:201-500(+)